MDVRFIVLPGDIKSSLLEISKKILVYASRQKKTFGRNIKLLNDFNAVDSNDERVDGNFNLIPLFLFLINVLLYSVIQLTALKLLPHLLKRKYKKKSKSEIAIAFRNSYKVRLSSILTNIFYNSKLT